ncbi:MAG: ribosome recycling factor, partial [Isosphaeraceae bacterium]
MSIEEIALEAEDRMEKSVALLTDQLRGVRTGRANTGLVDSIRVDYYGSSTPLKQLANLSTPEPQQILIRPFDPSVVGDIVKAIQTSDLGLTPHSDGKVVRLNVPPLSVEQRKKLSHRVKDLAEEARVAIRNIRRDANKQAEVEQSDKT